MVEYGDFSGCPGTPVFDKNIQSKEKLISSGYDVAVNK